MSDVYVYVYVYVYVDVDVDVVDVVVRLPGDISVRCGAVRYGSERPSTYIHIPIQC